MNIPIEQFLTSGAGIISTAIGLITMWNKFQNKLDNLEQDRIEDLARMNEERQEHRRQMEAMWVWKDGHERSASEQRERYNREIAMLEGKHMAGDERHSQVMSRLDDILSRLSALEKK